MIEEHTLADGAQTAEAIADRLVGWLGEARHSLDIALYAPGAVHDYMHAKITVADDVAFVGSFNLSAYAAT